MRVQSVPMTTHHQRAVSGRRAKMQEDNPVPVLEFWSAATAAPPGDTLAGLAMGWPGRVASVVAVGNQGRRDVGGMARVLLDGWSHKCDQQVSNNFIFSLVVLQAVWSSKLRPYMSRPGERQKRASPICARYF